ncbi:unnamed protein product (macronuclear) [Paramecium tetraurelia]|uniref:UvrD-like helicase ATP-binding domain-containing protein n=1 Tax=Paramecium tetraurelia TaxID=5888 RepID=A0BLV7_PARTE|nr:uncharacterized protein GSPATT00030158001 [Paramecium tetraurelia]CAK59524.1 unnamed protein product [Paramecium tetraurelia]|eukprot:XP_001426922.1 hypothetical protein (macronuclear) [Paramecium tetraurelia strain d4-2]
MRVKKAQEQNDDYNKEEKRLNGLGASFNAQYRIESINFITEFIPRFLKYYANSQKRDKYANELPLISVTNSPIREILAKFDINLLFPERIWEFSMTPTFLWQLTKHEYLAQNLAQILYMMKLILRGHFEFRQKPSHWNQNDLSDSHMYRLIELDHKSNLHNQKIYEVCNQFKDQEKIAVQIIPKQKYTLNSQNQLSTLQYVGTIVFICYSSYEGKSCIEQYLSSLLEDPFLSQDLVLLQKIEDRNVNQCYIKPRKYKIKNFQPNEFKFSEQLQRWIKKMDIIHYKNRIQMQNELESQQYLLKKYLFTPNFEQYRNLLKNIKSEKFSINMEQFKAISQEGDIILIGRSGTGKTTISLLKLFITDAIFMLRQNLNLFKESSKINLQYNKELQSGIQLRTLFLTSSPLLAQQIKQKYENMVKNVEENLRQKKEVQRISEQQKDNLNDSTVQILDVLGEQNENEGQFGIEDEDEDEDENEEDVDQYEKEMGCFQTIQDIKQFPAFLTIRKLLFLIDSSLHNSFFKNKDKIHGSAQWHNEYSGVLSLNQNFINNFSQKLDSEVHDLDSKEIIYHNNKLKEVSLEIFKEFFWPKILQEFIQIEKASHDQLDPMLIWSEIITLIKGNEKSYLFNDFHLSQEEYLKIHRPYKNSNPYSRLKTKHNYYDILDLINHINYQQTFCFDTIQYMHYIILDELQDVPKALLILLNRMTHIQLFLAGDNAQNIVKGIGMHFSQTVSCLQQENNYKQPIRNDKYKISKIILSYNFRSSHQILQLGNTLVNALELLFPSDIDLLQKEKSCQQGPKPTIIQGCENKDLTIVEFGCNSVIIVKDQNSKLKIPIELQNAIVLTIYEAKGLEFEDVILFNFFTDTNTEENEDEDDNVISFFRYLEIVKIRMDKNKWDAKHKRINYLSCKNINQYEVELTILQKVESKKKKQQDVITKNLNKFNISLQHELKQLYVAVTRPKRKLMIFDQQLQNRKYIQKIWEQLDIVEIIYDTQLQQIQEKQFVLSFSIDNKANWKKQGYRMLRQSNYDQAYKCFMFATEIELAKKCMAYHLTTQATLNEDNKQQFIQAAQIFEETNLTKRAASCYFSAKNYSKAFQLYQQLDCKNEMAESAYFMRQYKLAGQLFSELGEIRRAIECFNKQKLWDDSLDQVNLNKEQLTTDEKLMFLSIIVPKYLKSIIEDIEKQELLQQEQENLIKNQSDSFQVENSLVNDNLIEEKNNKEDDLEIINLHDDSQSFQVVIDQSLDHLSSYDPDDEWLKIDKESLIRSISFSSVESKLSNVLLMNQFTTIPLLKSRQNIFIKNNVMLHISKRFQQFQNEFKLLLENQKSQSSLLSFKQTKEQQLDDANALLQDLENLDIKSVYFVLDILEYCKNYKLCIYVCNQFKLSQNLGRYLISLASQYTPINKNKFKLENWIIGNNLKRKHLLDQSILAQMTFNNILESINPIYLEYKNEDTLHYQNSFGIECYKSLIGLGYWRTIIYQLNYENAVKLCQSFNNYQDWVILIQKIKEPRLSKQLTDEEQFQLIKNNYFIQVEQYFLSNQSKNNINIDEIFEITIQSASQKKLNKENIIQLLNNSKLHQVNLTNQDKFKQIESIILCMICCMGILKLETDSYSQIIDLVNLQQYCINQLLFAHLKPNIIEALQFVFKFSFPTGDIMIDYSQFCIIHITSKLVKNLNNQMIFIDIAYEYILIPFEALCQLFKQYFCNSKPIVTLFSTIKNQEDQQETINIIYCLKQRLQYQFQNILPNITQYQQDKIDYYSKVVYGIRQRNPINVVDDHETSILHFTKSDELRTVHKWLLQTNFRIDGMDKQIRYYLKNECILLFEQGLIDLQQKHGFFVLALNLLHLQDNMPFAIFTLQSMKEKEESNYYLKYLEFLECQHYDIIEDSFDCFIAYNQYFENQIYLDEWMNHLIRIGIKLLLAQEGITQIFIPQRFQDIISSKLEFDQSLFKLSKTDIILEFIESLQQFIETCNSEHYEYQSNLLLIVFTLNILNLTFKIKEKLCQIFSNDSRYPFYIKIHQCLIQKNSNLQQELINKMDVLFIKGYFEEKILTVQIKQNVQNLNSQEVYQNCLSKWEGYFQEAQTIRNNGINLLKKWRQFRSQQKIRQQVPNKLNPKVIKFYQFNKLQLKDIQQQFNWIQHESLIIKIYNLQEELLRLRQNILNGADLQFINQVLNNSASILREIKIGNLQCEAFEELKLQYQSWRDRINTFEKNEQELLERNRQILKLKWQKVQAGVKVQRKFDSRLIQTVEEHPDEEAQD